MARAIVTFARGWQALAVTRSLGKQGVDVYCGEEAPFAPCFFSRYCTGSFRYPSFADDPEGNARGVLEICRALTDSGFLPVAPQVYLPQFLDEANERDRALSLCLELVGACDEVRVYGGRITSGMRREIEYAEARGIPVRFADAEATG